MSDTKATSEKIETEVKDLLGLAKSLKATEEQLMQNEAFRNFIEMQKEYNERSTAFWKEVETRMIDNDIKSIKGDWGSLSIAERIGWTIDTDLLPAKFIKKSPDTTKITATYRLEGKAPKGCEPYTTKYLTKRFK